MTRINSKRSASYNLTHGFTQIEKALENSHKLSQKEKIHIAKIIEKKCWKSA